MFFTFCLPSTSSTPRAPADSSSYSLERYKLYYCHETTYCNIMMVTLPGVPPSTNWRGRTPRCSCDLSTLPKPTTPSIVLSSGLSWLALAFHRELTPSPANSTTACGHACGGMVASARICSRWSRLFGKGPLLFNIFSRRCCTWRGYASPPEW